MIMLILKKLNNNLEDIEISVPFTKPYVYTCWRILQNVSVLCYYYILFDQKIPFLLIYLQNNWKKDRTHAL